MGFDKIKSRLPGGVLFYRLNRAFSVGSRDFNPEDRCEAQFMRYRNARIKQYFSGYKNIDADLTDEKIFDFLCDIYTDKENTNLLNINGIKLIKPVETTEKLTFTGEFLDFLSYKSINNEKLCNSISYEGPYEYGITKVESGDTVIDCGANMGLFSAMAVCAGAYVYAFEPEESVKNRYLEKLKKEVQNITIVPSALSDSAGVVRFAVCKDNVGSNSIANIGMSVVDDENTVFTEVQAITLDEFVKSEKIEKVDFIKADIEGAERNMLRGATEVLKNFAPKLAICTYHLPDDKKVLTDIIMKANPKYVVIHKFKKLYAYVPK